MTSSDNGDLSIKKPLQGVTDESSLALIIQPRQMARVKWRCALQPSDITVQFQLKLEFLGAKTTRQVEHISVAGKADKISRAVGTKLFAQTLFPCGIHRMECRFSQNTGRSTVRQLNAKAGKSA